MRVLSLGNDRNVIVELTAWDLERIKKDLETALFPFLDTYEALKDKQ